MDQTLQPFRNRLKKTDNFKNSVEKQRSKRPTSANEPMIKQDCHSVKEASF